MNVDKNTPCCHTHAAAGAEDPNMWELALDELAYEEKFAGRSKDQTSDTPTRTNSLVVTIRTEELGSLILIQVKSADEVT